MRTWIKICGTTCVEDALLAIEAGADALGFVFAPSKRRVTPKEASGIVAKLPAGTERIGVFLNATVSEVRRVLSEVDLSGIQLHGDESVSKLRSSLPRELREPLRVIKTIVVDEDFRDALDREMVSGADAWLLDSGAGSGKTFDWSAARAQLGERQGRFIIAGGLTPDNVGEVIRTFSPWGVDVVSGVEREPGRKDPEKLKVFVNAVRQAESQQLEKV